MSPATAEPEMPEDPSDPRLNDVARLRGAIAHVPWFAAAGEALTAADRDEAALYLNLLGFPGTAVAPVSTWRDARRVADDPGWDHRWWDAEEAVRADLIAAAARHVGEAPLARALTRVSDTASDIVQGAAAVAAARAGLADPALIKCAAGAATQSCYLAALALAAGVGNDHVFRVKYRLFEAGRWPLGIVRDVFYLF